MDLNLLENIVLPRRREKNKSMKYKFIFNTNKNKRRKNLTCLYELPNKDTLIYRISVNQNMHYYSYIAVVPKISWKKELTVNDVDRMFHIIKYEVYNSFARKIPERVMDWFPDQIDIINYLNNKKQSTKIVFDCLDIQNIINDRGKKYLEILNDYKEKIETENIKMDEKKDDPINMDDIKEKVLNLLNIKIKEEFKLKDAKLDKLFDSHFRLNEYLYLECSMDRKEWKKSKIVINDIICGRVKIVKTPKLWKPSIGDKYWTFSFNAHAGAISEFKWNNDEYDLAKYVLGLTYKTEEEAEIVLNIVRKKIDESVVNNKPLIDWFDKT